MERLCGKVNKSWGYEDIIVTNDLYCAKYLVFDNEGSRTSMHFHKNKHETWKVIKGSFIVSMINTLTSEVNEIELNEGQTWVNEPLMIHQLISKEKDSCVLEISTADSIDDNYRVWR